jgi:hypothetical protein
MAIFSKLDRIFSTQERIERARVLEHANRVRSTEHELRLRRQPRQEEIGFAGDAPPRYSRCAQSFWIYANASKYRDLLIEMEELSEELPPRAKSSKRDIEAIFCEYLHEEPHQMTDAQWYAEAWRRMELAEMLGINTKRFQRRLDEIGAEAPHPNPPWPVEEASPFDSEPGTLGPDPEDLPPPLFTKRTAVVASPFDSEPGTLGPDPEDLPPPRFTKRTPIVASQFDSEPGTLGPDPEDLPPPRFKYRNAAVEHKIKDVPLSTTGASFLKDSKAFKGPSSEEMVAVS